MKTYENSATAVVEGAAVTKELGIAANAKAFKELISGIYADKAYAIARETIANAVDSHVQAGIPDRPIVIHVPTLLEPNYSIRDFGVSMTHDLVMNLFSTLFLSTKDDPNSDDSNRYVGKFGLGSKSPFAYTDAFQLECYLGGTVRIYDVFFNAGMPQIALLHQGDTEEENGVLVSFGVQQKDFSDFNRAIKRAVEGLDVLPIFTGMDITPHKRQVRASGKGWMLLDATQSGYAEARQGTVLYPLNSQAVINLPPNLSPLFSAPFRFDFEIGQLDVVTSREALSYDAVTSANIITRLEEVLAEIRGVIADGLSGAKTYWEFSKTYFHLLETYPEKIFGPISAVKPTFKGRAASAVLSVSTRNVYEKVKFFDEKLNIEGEKVVHHLRFGTMTYCKISGFDMNNKSSLSFRPDKNASKDHISLDVSKPLIVLIEDMRDKNRYPVARVSALMASMDTATKRQSQMLWIRHYGDKQYVMNRLFVGFGRPDMTVVNLMDIPFIAPPRQYFTGQRSKFKLLKDGGWVTPDPTTPIPDEALWVPMINGGLDEKNTQFRIHEINVIKKTLVNLGDIDYPVVGVPKSSRRIIKDQPGWRFFDDYAIDTMTSVFDAKSVEDHMYKEGYGGFPTIVETLRMLRSAVGDDVFNAAVTDTVVEPLMHRYDAKEAANEEGKWHEVILNQLIAVEHRRNSAARATRKEIIRGLEARRAAGDSDVPADPETVVEDDTYAHLVVSIRGRCEAIDAEAQLIVNTAKEAYPILEYVEDNLPSGAGHAIFFDLINYIASKRLTTIDMAVAA